MKLSFILIIILLSQIMVAQSKYTTIQGTIRNESDKTPLIDVNVSLANSTIGCSTDKNGFYKIGNLQLGRYKIIVSALGYATITQDILINKHYTYTLSFNLTPAPVELPTVLVVDDNSEWLDNLEIFTQQLIGISKNAENTEIVNTKDLSFNWNEDTLTAIAYAPLIIINHTLGYKIKYYLESFTYYDITAKFNGFPVFSELVPRDSSEQQIWNKNRIKTYAGSLPHFLNSLSRDYDKTMKMKNPDSLNNINSILEQEGFEIFRSSKKNVSGKYLKILEPYEIKSIIYPGEYKNEKIIGPENDLIIWYDRKYMEDNYYEFINSFSKSEVQKSKIKFHSNIIYFDNKGRYWDLFKIQLYGYWSFLRLADMLPLNYSIEPSVLKSLDFK